MKTTSHSNQPHKMSDLTEQARRVLELVRLVNSNTQDRCLAKEELSNSAELLPLFAREYLNLIQWKESALSIMPDWQELGRLLNCTLGEDVPLLLLPRIRELRAEVDRLAVELSRYQLYFKNADDLRQNYEDRYFSAKIENDELKADLQAARKAMEDGRKSFGQLLKAMRRYEMDVDDEPSRDHVSVMTQAEEALAALNAELGKK